MPSTHCALYVHVVFTTKNRVPLIHAEWRHRLHEYLGGTLRGLDAHAHAAGGTEDHVHLLIGLKPTHVLADLVRETKKTSSTWVREEIGASDFAWQPGYACFSVSATGLDGVRQYIAKQEEHHRQHSFREELVEMLKRAGVEYDPQFLD